MKRLSYFPIVLISILIIAGSCKKDDPGPVIPADVIKTNEWIYETLTTLYLWKDFIPAGIDLNKEPDPKEYFEKLIYREKDDWSRITDDYQGLQAEFNGVPVTMGYNPYFFLYSNTKVGIVVTYVYPGSAASDAGLVRGDIILKINNTQLDTSNYVDLYSEKSYSVQLAELQGNTLVLTGESFNLTARVTSTDPAIHHEVILSGGHKIGYFAYTEFIAGTNDALLTSMNNIFSEFKTAGVTDLIVDLRYNPGGDIDAAVQLASLIGPSSILTAPSTMIKFYYNTELQQFFETGNYTDNLLVKFKNVSQNLNLSRVYFLTTQGSASASELVIIGLKPYMNVVTIGENTYGKYVASWVIPDDNEVWAMMPIVSKFANSAGFTDFVNGLTPDYPLEDDPFHAKPFGDITDPLTAKAISLITGAKSLTEKSEAVTFAREVRQLFPRQLENRRNLVIRHDRLPELK